MLKIGTHNSQAALRQAAFTQAELARVGMTSELVIFQRDEEALSHPGWADTKGKDIFTKEMEDALLCGEIDLAVHELKYLPTQAPEGLVTTAVSKRINPAELLAIRPEAFDPARIFKVKAGAVIAASDTRCKTQMQDIRPDTEILDLYEPPTVRQQKLRDGLFDTIFLAASDVQWLELDLGGLEVVELNPREFVPAPAQGVLAWLTNRDDLPTRRMLKQIHHPEVSACTNVERRVLQLFNDDDQLPLGVYCERDLTGNFHAFAACLLHGEMRRAHVSRSTSAGMAEALYERLVGG